MTDKTKHVVGKPTAVDIDRYGGVTTTILDRDAAKAALVEALENAGRHWCGCGRPGQGADLRRAADVLRRSGVAATEAVLFLAVALGGCGNPGIGDDVIRDFAERAKDLMR